jgi:hypothetical protein
MMHTGGCIQYNTDYTLLLFYVQQAVPNAAVVAGENAANTVRQLLATVTMIIGSMPAPTVAY